MTKRRYTSPDWPSMIDDLVLKGHTAVTICAAIGVGTNESIIRHYRRGVQPMYYRGEPLIAFWCAEMGKALDEVPRVAVLRPYRVPYRKVNTTATDAVTAATASLHTFIAAPQPVQRKARKAKKEPA